MSKQIASGSALGLQYRVHARTGNVESTDTRSETEVSGNVSGGGGYSHQGTGYSAPVSGSIQSKTTRYQNIFLTDETGKEHTIQLVNYLIPCKQGQKLTMFLLTTGKSDSGSYFQAYNHNSREHYPNTKALRSEVFPRLLATLAVLVIGILAFISGNSGPEGSGGQGVFMAIVWMVISGIVLWIVGSVMAGIRSRMVQGNAAYKRFREGITEAR